MKSDVTKVIDIIRRAADQIFHGSDEEDMKKNITSLKVQDTESLIDGFKLLVDSSDYDEQVRLLTLAPRHWGGVQIEQFFSCNQWQARKAIETRASFGILSSITNFSGNSSIDPLLVEEIRSFYQMDDISRQTANKKEVIHINKQPVAIRYLSMTIGQAYQIFSQHLKSNTPWDFVSKSVFYSLRPKWVKTLTPHDVCGCIYHENFNLLIEVLQTPLR